MNEAKLLLISTRKTTFTFLSTAPMSTSKPASQISVENENSIHVCLTCYLCLPKETSINISNRQLIVYKPNILLLSRQVLEAVKQNLSSFLSCITASCKRITLFVA